MIRWVVDLHSLGQAMFTKSARPSRATGVSNLVHSDRIVTPLESGLTNQRLGPRCSIPSEDQTSSSVTRTASDTVHSNPKPGRKTFELDEIRSAIQTTSDFLRDQMSEARIMSMVKLSMAHWEQYCRRVLQKHAIATIRYDCRAGPKSLWDVPNTESALTGYAILARILLRN